MQFQRETIVNTVMSAWVSEKMANFLKSRVTTLVNKVKLCDYMLLIHKNKGNFIRLRNFISYRIFINMLEII